MRKIVFAMVTMVALSACKNSTKQAEEKSENQTSVEVAEAQAQEPEINYYGDTIDMEGAVEAEKLMAMMEGQDSLPVKLMGTVNSSCQKKGCWMKMDLGDGQEMRVSFRDYSFFVPKNLGGQTAVVEGYAYVDTIDVAFLKHLAEDAGKSQEEIDAINEPEISVNYLANGVIIKNQDA